MEFYETALKLIENENWKYYLGKDEGIVFENVTETPAKFKRFLSNPADKTFKNLFENIAHSLGKEFPTFASCRIRCMLTEYEIDLKTAPNMGLKVINNQSLFPIDHVYHSLEYDSDLIPCLNTFNFEENIVKTSKNTEIVDKDLKSAEEETLVDAPSGLQYMMRLLNRNCNPSDFKHVKKIIFEATPRKSKWVFF